jgi:hypothetical protein
MMGVRHKVQVTEGFVSRCVRLLDGGWDEDGSWSWCSVQHVRG